MVRAFSQITIAKSGDDEDVVGPRQISIDSKARRGSKMPPGGPNICFPHSARLVSNWWSMSHRAEAAWNSTIQYAF